MKYINQGSGLSFILMKRSRVHYSSMYFKSQRNLISSDLNGFCETKTLTDRCVKLLVPQKVF